MTPRPSTNKPLPSPPVAQVMTGIIEEPRSLIDASEKPLLRSSPKSQDEEWPTLSPRKITSMSNDHLRGPENPRHKKVLTDDAETKALQLSTGAVRDSERKASHSDPRGLSAGALNNSERKASSSKAVQLSTGALNDSERKASHSKAVGLPAGALHDSEKASHSKALGLSAGAAAVEKASETNSIKEPRQTKTSSLRARISAGQVTKDSPNKVLGFTDFTVEKLPRNKDQPTDTNKSPKDSLRGSRGPAQIVAGSRPITHRISRGSLRTESSLEPFRPAPPIPDDKRRSAIPIPLNSTSKTDGSSIEPIQNGINHPLKPEDPVMIKPLESIEESPQSTIHTKCITALGPTLTVSSSADRLIMGGNQSKENRPLMRKRSKDMLRAAVSGQKKYHPEEMTSQGIHHSSSQAVRGPSNQSIRGPSQSIRGPQSIRRPSSQAIRGPSQSTRRPLSSQGFPENRSAPKKVHTSFEVTDEKEETTSKAFFIANPKTSPLKNSATSVSDTMPVVSAFLPETMQEHVKKMEHASYTSGEVRTQDDEFPPRSSSHTKHPDYTSPTSSFERTATRLQNEISAQTVERKIDPDDFFPLTTTPSHRQMSSQTILADPSKRDSTAHNSTRSQSSLSKGLKSGLRGLFHHKRSSETLTYKEKTGKRPTVNGSPTISMSDIHPLYRPKTTRSKTPQPESPDNNPGTEISTTTALAMDMLEAARKADSSPKKKRLLSMAELVVDVITQARNAEKAYEEAKRATREAEIADAMCKRGVSEIAGLVKTWNFDE
ncbi:MAG: hypothetical protein LQ352_002115 [Teloschistes flavicans]|nr:MAG: hypothetical protein LQ352_002115 [Teloschistes flavicans]